jgi:PTH1 family peptidyl-tRNA hydrolase
MPIWPFSKTQKNMPETPVRLIVGLGNPGRDYKDNRHNLGFMVVDRLSVRLDARGMKLQSKALVITTTYNGARLILAKPQTYMNLSGQSVQGLLRFYRIPLDSMLVAYDDLDLPFGTLRLRPGGGPGGQNGVASIIQQLRTQEFPRLRIGIDRPPRRMDPADYVLQDFPASDLIALSDVLERAAEAALTFVAAGLDEAMNKFNGSVTM